MAANATEPVAAFAGSLGLEVKLLPLRDPGSKGMVARRNRFFRQRFVPGLDYRSPADFNLSWLTGCGLVANCAADLR
ncbi:hypothetical protein AB4089_22520 [Arthrobacter sp. 2MCAF15]|uniref:hypothetical protein n=1 Tax=Arthrobacter sp. 2MCAF15 TaxID=3232984 RepID=UPI003F921C5E